jgi:hypothetical protein
MSMLSTPILYILDIVRKKTGVLGFSLAAQAGVK